MRIFITGASGFIGSNLYGLLGKQRHEVVAFDKEISNFSNITNFWSVRGDCRKFGSINTAVSELKPDVIVHLAAIAVATECDKTPDLALDTNLNGLKNTLISAWRADVKRFVFISSSFVYGDFKYIPCDELHQLNPVGVYGGTKVAGEYIVKTFCNRFGMEWVIIRPSAVYGFGDKNKRVVQVLLENAINGNQLILNGAEEKMDFTCVDDTVDGIARACVNDKAIGQIFNITKGEGRSLGELAEIIRKLVPDIKIEKAEMNGFRPKRGALDISKARSLLGYEPKWRLEDGVLEYYRKMVNHK